MTAPDIAWLCERLRAVESMRRHGGNTTNWRRNPDGPEAADLIERLAAMLAASPQGEGSSAGQDALIEKTCRECRALHRVVTEGVKP